MNLKQLREARAKALAKAKSIQDTADKENRNLTDEESSEFDAAYAEVESFDAQMVRREKLESAAAKASVSSGSRIPGNSGSALRRDHTSSGDDDDPEAAFATTNIGTVKERFEDDPKKGFKNPREFCLSVIQAGRRGNQTNDKRLRFLATAGSDEQGEYADPYGGFLVPEGFSPQVLRIEPESDPMGARVTRIPMAVPTVKMAARVDKDHTSSVAGGLTVSRSAETAAKTASRMKFDGISLQAHSLFGLAYATEELLTDSPISFAAILAAGFNDQFTSHLIDERINGNGLGAFVGILNAPCLVTVSKEAGPQTADTIVLANLTKMRSRCWGYDRAIWMANHDCIPQLYGLNTTTNQLFTWNSSMREDVPDMLLGRPIVFTEYTKTLGDKGDIILCNWAEYLEGILQPLQSAESIHVRFVNHERAFKFWLRNAGMPWWNAALTPKNSTATLSPFVCVEAR